MAKIIYDPKTRTFSWKGMLSTLGGIATAFALSNGNRNAWGRYAMERKKKEKMRKMNSADPKDRAEGEAMDIKPTMQDVIGAPHYNDIAPGNYYVK
jgi:hypothetical protein